MAFDALTTAEIAVGQPMDNTLWTKVKDNFDSLNGSINGLTAADIPNGSAEVDSDADGTPDNWTKSAYPGGTVTRSTSANAQGTAAFSCVHPGGAGNGGGYWESDYVVCSPQLSEVIGVVHWATAAGMKNQVVIRQFDEDQVDISDDKTLYSSTANPTSATPFIFGFTPSSTARYYKVRMIGGFTDTDVSGTAYFDGLTRQPNFGGAYATAGSFVIAGVSAERTATTSSLVKAYEFGIQSDGQVDVKFQAKADSSAFDMEVDIYIDGVSSGVSATYTNIGTTYVDKTLSSVDVKRGEKLQVYMRETNGSNLVYMRDVQLVSTTPAPVCAGVRVN